MAKKIQKIPLLVLVAIIAFNTWLCYRSFQNYYEVEYPIEYEELVEKYCKEYDVEPAFVLGVIRTESSFNPNAESVVGAKGLMQLTNDTFKWVQHKLHGKVIYKSKKLFDEEINIQHGVYFIKLLKDEFKDDQTVLAAYHAGRGRVNEWLADTKYSKDGVTLSYIPYEDTSGYVEKCYDTINIYRKLYVKGD